MFVLCELTNYAFHWMIFYCITYRNLFFRVSSLLQLDIIPVIVVEGVAPDLKQEVMRKRLAAQNGPSHNAISSRKLTRKNFMSVHREVCIALVLIRVSAPYLDYEVLVLVLSTAGISLFTDCSCGLPVSWFFQKLSLFMWYSQLDYWQNSSL